MDIKNWTYIGEFIHSILRVVKNELDMESIDSVKHFLDHAEYEMAFEGLFIEIMSLKSVPQIDLVKCKEVGELLKLNEESVFDFEFWNKFEDYLIRNGHSRFKD